MCVKQFILLFSTIMLLNSCSSKPVEQTTINNQDKMEKVDFSVLGKEDVFNLIGNEWMLVTAGNSESFNTMTASWGGFAWLWNKPVAFIFIRPERYTHEFIEANERLTLSFYPNDMKKALQICGTKSGRDSDKVKEAGLTPVSTEKGNVTFEQARMTLECRKLFKTEMESANFLDLQLRDRWYNEQAGGLHTIYVVEIEDIFAK